MKVRRVLVRTDKETGAKFYRHDVTLPAEMVDALGWTFGTDLVARPQRNGIFFEKAKR